MQHASAPRRRATTRHREKSDAFVFFGATGDLARKQIFPALYGMVKSGRLDVPVIGVAFSQWSLDDLVARARESLEHVPALEEAVVDRLIGLLRYVDGDYNDPATFAKLKEELGEAKRPTHYLAIPPVLFGTVIEGLAAHKLNKNAQVVVEKPFGRDLESAIALNEIVRRAFPEEAIFRIDHFLGKEEIMNLIYFRFANSFLEPVWNRNYIDHIQITVAEDFGIQGRGPFYESAGALRDVIENHVFQIVALLAMEPPAYQGYLAVHEAKTDVFKAMRPLTRDDIVRGQFRGYRDEEGVAADSDVETYAAVRLEIDSWRWSGVPWFLRTGKMLPAKVAEVIVEFKRPPQALFDDAVAPGHHPNHLRFRLSPNSAIALGARVKTPGEQFVGSQRELLMETESPLELAPYELLLADALEGDRSLYTSEDAIESAWIVVDAILDDHAPAIEYEPGTWGPQEADRLIGSHGVWHNPSVEDQPARQARKPKEK
jgi:glucose-6-phosphate 1-dehydrogenase